MGSDAATKNGETRVGREGAPSDVERFVERFAEAWAVGAEGIAAFESLLHPDVLLTHSVMPPARGLDGFREYFAAIFAALPDLRGEVLAWGATEDGVLIDLALHATVGGRPVELVTCDRIVLRDGLLLERHARMDPMPLVLAALRSPRLAMRMLRPHPAARNPGRGLAGLAVGRLALGAAARFAPHRLARAFGAKDPASGELAYMSRIFGARAIALGSGYLLSSGDARRRWQRLALGVDVSDTVAGVGHLRRRDIPAAHAVGLIALTGGYAAVGAAQLVRDLSAGA